MPNWCLIGFTVMGDPAEVDRFKAMMITERPSESEGKPVPFLDFGGIIPVPPEFEGRTTERYADFGGSVPDEREFEAWAVENWGTKWDAQNLMLRRGEPGRVGFQFDTAWDFPFPVFDALADEFPTLVFRGSAIEDNKAFAYRGHFNGPDDWDEVDPETFWGDDDHQDDEEEDDDNE
jgi:hypothetical protein